MCRDPRPAAARFEQTGVACLSSSGFHVTQTREPEVSERLRAPPSTAVH
jgi:hypothetical protein